MLKQKILEIYNSYLDRIPHLKKEKTIILCLEGLGTYKGKARRECLKKHPKGRMGAVYAIIINGELFYTSYASTLPDDPMGPGKYNDGTPVPTVQSGVYNLYSKLHKGRPAMELGLNNEKIPVIRNIGLSTSTAINIHNRAYNDSERYASSTGCITVLTAKFNPRLETLGVLKNGKFIGSGHYIGKIIIDRSQIDKNLQKLYKGIYGSFYEYFFNTSNSDELEELEKENDELRKELEEMANKQNSLKEEILESIERWT